VLRRASALKYVVATLGSLGDLHPFLAVARALRERGEDVLFLSQEPHRNEVEAQGVSFEAIATAHDHQRTTQHPALWHPIRGFGVLWRHLAMPAINPTVAILERLCHENPGRLRVFASPLVVGARLAADVLPFRLTTGHTAPAALRSVENPMFIGARSVPLWVPPGVRRCLWRALDRHKLEPMAAPRINAWRTAHGLAPLAAPVFERWIHSQHDVIAMFPQEFGPMPADWPVPVQFAGFPLYEAGDPTDDDPELDDFCRGGDGAQALILLYPGSCPAGTTTEIHRAAHNLALRGHRCLLLDSTSTGARHTVSMQARLLIRRRVRLPDVLPHTHVFVHHGGIGAVAQALAFGVTQVIRPSAYDQFDNDWRVKAMTNASTARSVLSLEGQIIGALTRLAFPVAWRANGHSLPLKPNDSVIKIMNRLTY